MKQTALILVLLCFGNLGVLAETTLGADTIQGNHEASFDIGAFRAPVLHRNFYGGYLEFRYYLMRRFSTGFTLSLAGRKVTDTFGYSVHQPVLDYYEVGWINTFDLIFTNRFRLGASLNNGLSISRLGHNAEREVRYSRYGSSKQSKKIATNCLYLLQPGMDFSYRIYSMKHAPDFYLVLKAKYRFAAGNPAIGDIEDYQGYNLGIGLSIIGRMD